MLTAIGQAGTLESNDIMVTIAPAETGSGVVIELSSPILKQFGRQIKAVIAAEIEKSGMTDMIVKAQDKGALDFTIKARVRAALERAMKKEV